MAEPKKPAAKPAARRKTTRKPAKTAEVKKLEEKVAALEARQQAEPDTEAAPPVNPQKYVRNITGSTVRFKLERHGPGHKGITLQSRGVRGDIQAVQPEDISDPIFQANNGLVFEVITAEEAANTVVKQTTNQQSVHPALSAIKNEKGQGQGEMKLVVDQSFEKQGVTVAKLDDGQLAFDRTGIKGRVRERGQTPGTPEYVSGAEGQHAPANEDPSFLSDAKAREKANTDLGLNVTVAPTQRTSGGIVSDGFNPDK